MGLLCMASISHDFHGGLEAFIAHDAQPIPWTVEQIKKCHITSSTNPSVIYASFLHSFLQTMPEGKERHQCTRAGKVLISLQTF